MLSRKKKRYARHEKQLATAGTRVTPRPPPGALRAAGAPSE